MLKVYGASPEELVAISAFIDLASEPPFGMDQNAPHPDYHLVIRGRGVDLSVFDDVKNVLFFTVPDTKPKFVALALAESYAVWKNSQVRLQHSLERLSGKMNFPDSKRFNK